MGGNCHTYLIACIWPNIDYGWETLSTLRFASRMKCVENNPIRNTLVPKESNSSVRPLLNTIEALKKELAIRDILSGCSEVWSAELHKTQINSAMRGLSRFIISGSNIEIVNDQICFPDIHSLSEMRFMFGAMREMLWEVCGSDKARVNDLIKSYRRQIIPDELFDDDHPVKADHSLSDVLFDNIETSIAHTNNEKKNATMDLPSNTVENSALYEVETMSNKRITFEEFKLTEGKSFQVKYEDIKDILKSSKERQKQIVRVINERKVDIDSCNEIIRRYRDEQSLSNELQGVVDVLNESDRIDSDSFKKSCEEVEKSKKAYREAHAELILCKKEIDELQSLKKKALAAIVDAYDAYCSL